MWIFIFFFLKKERTEAVSMMTPFPHSVQTNITRVRVGLHITQTNEHLQKFSGLSHWHQPDRGWKLTPIPSDELLNYSSVDDDCNTISFHTLSYYTHIVEFVCVRVCGCIFQEVPIVGLTAWNNRQGDFLRAHRQVKQRLYQERRKLNL